MPYPAQWVPKLPAPADDAMKMNHESYMLAATSKAGGSPPVAAQAVPHAPAQAAKLTPRGGEKELTQHLLQPFHASVKQ